MYGRTDERMYDHRTWKSRIRACVIGRESIYGGSDIVIIARTDVMAVEGYEAALERVCNASPQTGTTNAADRIIDQLIAARDCGADMGFLEAIETEEQIKRAVKVLAPMPVSSSVSCRAPKTDRPTDRSSSSP